MHRVIVDDCMRMQITGVKDVISFDLESVVLETEQGMLEISGNDLHVSRLSVEKGEVDVDGRVENIGYSEVSDFAKGRASLFDRLFR